MTARAGGWESVRKSTLAEKNEWKEKEIGLEQKCLESYYTVCYI